MAQSTLRSYLKLRTQFVEDDVLPPVEQRPIPVRRMVVCTVIALLILGIMALVLAVK